MDNEDPTQSQHPQETYARVVRNRAPLPVRGVATRALSALHSETPLPLLLQQHTPHHLTLQNPARQIPLRLIPKFSLHETLPKLLRWAPLPIVPPPSALSPAPPPLPLFLILPTWPAYSASLLETITYFLEGFSPRDICEHFMPRLASLDPSSS